MSVSATRLPRACAATETPPIPTAGTDRPPKKCAKRYVRSIATTSPSTTAPRASSAGHGGICRIRFTGTLKAWLWRA